MTQFREAFELGQEAAKKAEVARQEIASVFREVTAQLAETTDGKLEVYRDQLEKRIGTTILYPFAETKKYWAVVARNPTAANQDPIELAKWEQAREGYPCTLSWGDCEHKCHDREALEQGLVLLLRDAVVGEKLRRLLTLAPPTTKPGDTAASC